MIPAREESRFKAYHSQIFYACWFLFGLLQSLFTELQEDEAYYWVFSKFPDWGYYDHPPMIAVLIKAGTFLFAGELGVRLIPLFLNTATVYIIQKLTGNKAPFLFYAIILSLAVLQLSGFVAVPDIPLIFFTALFFLFYQRFLANGSWKNTVLLGLTAAAMLYSKYHGVLVIFFVLLSNLRLLRNSKVYAAGLIAFMLFLPHLYWQYQHNWITFRFHLFERDATDYSVIVSAEYLLGQLLLAGPLAGFVLWPAAFLYRTKNKDERAMKAVATGFFLFFLLSTLKGRVEANWTAPAIVPLVVLSHRYLLQKEGWRTWLFRLLPPTLLLVAVLRLAMVFDVFPLQILVERYHSWKGWPEELKQKTAGLPVVVNSSYQKASKYWFHAGVKAYSLNGISSRRNMFNFFPVEDSLLGKPVYTLSFGEKNGLQDSVKAPLFNVGYQFDSSFHSFTKIIFSSKEVMAGTKDSLRIHFDVKLPLPYKNYLQSHPGEDKEIALFVLKKHQQLSVITLPFTLQQVLKNGIRAVALPHTIPGGDYTIRFGIMTDNGYHTHNSERIKLTVTEN